MIAPGTTSSRTAVWHAMSDLYLDTEIDTWDLMVLADKLASADLSIEELERVFFEEVHPVCCWNLAGAAGVWGGLDKEWLEKRIADNSRRQQPKSWLKRLRATQDARKSEKLKDHVHCDWEKTKMLIELKRKGRLR